MSDTGVFKHKDGLGGELVVMPAHGPAFAAHVMALCPDAQNGVSVMLRPEDLARLRASLDICEAQLKERQATQVRLYCGRCDKAWSAAGDEACPKCGQDNWVRRTTCP